MLIARVLWHDRGCALPDERWWLEFFNRQSGRAFRDLHCAIALKCHVRLGEVNLFPYRS